MNPSNFSVIQLEEVTTVAAANSAIQQGWIFITAAWNGTALIYVMGKTKL